MKAFLIDPAAKTVSETVINEHHEIREQIGVDVIGAVYPRKESPRLILWIDDMGLLQDEVEPLWQISGITDILSGKGILLGLTDGDGDHMDCPFSQAEIEHNIAWRDDLVFKGLITTQDEVEHPIMGKTQHIKTEAIFEKKEPSDD